MSYTNGHRTFLQAMVTRPYINLREGQKIVAAIKSVESGQEGSIAAETIEPKEVYNYIARCADVITQFDLTIRDMADQENGHRIWALVNTADDEVIKLATNFSADEIAFFRRLLDAMFDTYNTREAEVMAITAMQALTLSKNPQNDKSQTQTQAATQRVGGDGEEGATQGATQPGTQMSGPGMGLTKQEAERALDKLTDLSWLELDEFFFLTTRAVLELELYLLENYNIPDEVEEGQTPGPIIKRIRHCNGCKYIHTIGKRCANLDCEFRIHEHCAPNFFKNRAATCPSCETAWDGKTYVGPKASKGTQSASALRKARRSSQGTSLQANRQRSLSAASEATDYGRLDEDARPTPVQSSRRKRSTSASVKKTKRAKTSRTTARSESVDEDEDDRNNNEDEEEEEAVQPRRQKKKSAGVNGITKGVRKTSLRAPTPSESEQEEEDSDEERIIVKDEKVSEQEEDEEEDSEQEDDDENNAMEKEDEEEEEEEEEEEPIPTRHQRSQVSKGKQPQKTSRRR